MAHAGSDRQVFLNLQCQLDGSRSSGRGAAYAWRTVTIPAGSTAPAISQASSSKAFFTPTGLGTYEFTLELSNSLGVSTDEVAVTVVPFVSPSVEAGFFGVCAHLNSHDASTDSELDQSLQAMATAGVQYVRFDFDWKTLEPENDSFSFTKYATIVDKLVTRQIKTLAIFDYGNNWSDPTTGNTEQINHFADFVFNTVSHFKDRVRYWQIWNEPNNDIFWPSASAANYTKLLIAAYGAAKQADPACVVILGGLVGNGRDELTVLGRRYAAANFLPDVYSNGGQGFFDVAAIHPYNYSTDISSTTALETAIDVAKNIMAANGDSGRPLWLTELGPLYFPPTAITWLSDRGYTEAEIAAWLTLIYTNLKSKCDKLFWYELRDYPSASTMTDANWEGLIKADFTPKAAFTSYQNLSK